MAERDAIGLWLEGAGRVPLLTAAEEVHLGTMVQVWQQWDGGPDAAPAGVRRRGLRARDRMVRANLRLVASVARSTGAALVLGPVRIYPRASFGLIKLRWLARPRW